MDPINQEPYIQYLLFKIRLSKFKRFMKFLIVFWIIAAIASFIHLRDSPVWLISNLWIIFSIIAIGESIELWYIVKKSKKLS